MTAPTAETGPVGPMGESDGPPPPAGNGSLAANGRLQGLEWAFRSDPGDVRPHNEDFAGAAIPPDFPAPDLALQEPAPPETDLPETDLPETDPPEVAPDGPGDARSTDGLSGAMTRGPLFVLCDGLGGHSSGEVASRTAVEAALATWRASRRGAAHQAARAAARAANVAVYDASLAPGRRGMGTTLTGLTFSGSEAVICHVGDSRAYLVRAGVCSQLTADHSRVGEMLRMGLISAEQAAVHPGRSQLTRSIGTDLVVQVDVVRTATEPDDVFVLCSDGLWDVVARHEVAEIASSAVGPPGASKAGTDPVAMVVDRLVERALARRTPDNVTVLVVRLAVDPVPSAPGRRSGRLRWGRR